MKKTKEINIKSVGASPMFAQKGITLISLVITILLMMILAGVTIKIATDGGLFDKAKEAVGKTENAIKQEQQLVNEILDEYFKPNSSEDNTEEEGLPADLKVGDYVNYTPTAGTYKVADGQYGTGYTTTDGYQSFTTETGEAALKWRVLSIDEENGSVELVAATQSSTPLYLQGADGYNHAVDILNDLCEKLYSNKNGAIARSIKVEDINAKATYDYTTYNNGTFTYGDTKQLKTYGIGYMFYPNLYSQEKGYGNANIFNTSGLNVSEGLKDGMTDGKGLTTYNTVIGSTDGNTAGTDPYITHTYYYYNIENYLKTNFGVNSAPAGLIKTGTTYWLASRCIYAATYGAYPGVRCLSADGGVDYVNLIYSNGEPFSNSCAVRPVVSLGSNLTLTKDLANSTEDTTYWNIEY